MNDELALAASIGRAQRKRETLFRIFTGNAAGAVLLGGYALLRLREDRVAMLLLEVLMILGLGILIRRHRSATALLEAGTLPVAQAARVAMDIVRNELKMQTVLLRFACIALPCFAFAAISLVGSGKMRPRDAANFGVVCLGIVLVNAIIALRRRYAVLLPQQRRLDELISSL